MSSNIMIAKRFKLGEKVGSGAFGEIYTSISVIQLRFGYRNEYESCHKTCKGN